MSSPKYQRDLFDGPKQVSSEHMDRPDTDQPYFDDTLVTFREHTAENPLVFLLFGKEQSAPNRNPHRQVTDYILHYVTSGKGTFNGRSVTAGQGFLVLPDVPHQMIADSCDPWHFKWICFRGSIARWLLKSVGLDEDNRFFDFSFGDRLEALFDDVIYGDHGDCDLNTYMQGIFYIILSYHKKQFSERPCRKDTGNDYAAQAIRYMDEHYREPLSVDTIAATLHISRKYLCTVMERSIGMSTKEYLLRRRVNAAAELLLHTNLTVAEIANQVGYGDYTQFSRLFRTKKGLSPLQFRKQKQATAERTQ